LAQSHPLGAAQKAIASRPADRLRLAASSLAQVGNRNQSEGGGMRRTILLITVLVLALAPSASAKDTFVATLSGDEEVPARDTQAVGVAKFKLSKDGAALTFKINVSNIQNVVAAHIHCGAVGVNGPIGVTLFMGAPAGGRVNGTLAEGTITAPDPGNACGWADLAAVLAAIESGATYVNVHTNDGVAPPNTGPGDFPGGEIRGQIR
jgi:CHRD domain